MWRLAYSIPLWLAYCAVTGPLWIVGALIIPPLACARAWELRPSWAYADKRPLLCWRVRLIDLVWGNAEDGVTGAAWYRDLHADWSDTKRAIFWSAFRNPTNNMRFIPIVNPRLRASRIRYRGEYDPETAAKQTGRVAYSFAWQGIYAGLYVIVPIRGRLYRFWWGWKIRPRDTAGIAITDYRYPRCGFATQLKRVEA